MKEGAGQKGKTPYASRVSLVKKFTSSIYSEHCIAGTMLEETWVTVHTTTPKLPPSASRPHVTTPRLLIRPLQASDLDGLHKLRTQPEVMRWSVAGRIDKDKDETAQKLAWFLPPNNDTKTFNCAMCWRETGEFIGIGGMHQRNRVGMDVGAEESFGWPELGYMFVKEYWGMGLATEFVRAFVQMWEVLEREPVEMTINRKSLVDDNVPSGTVPTVKGQLIAMIDKTNTASEKILRKCGFEKFIEFEESHQKRSNQTLTLQGFRWSPLSA